MNSLEAYRNQIDALDAQLIRTLGERFEVCREIARFKREQLIPMMQSGRVEEVKRRCAGLGQQYGINPQLIVEIYGLIIDEICRMEDSIIGNTPERMDAA